MIFVFILSVLAMWIGLENCNDWNYGTLFTLLYIVGISCAVTSAMYMILGVLI
jgi:hypothetical protein